MQRPADLTLEHPTENRTIGFSTGRILGKGTTALVLEGVDCVTGNPVAIKRIDLAAIRKADVYADREIKIMTERLLGLPNLVQIEARSAEPGMARYVYIVMTYGELGSLSNFLNDRYRSPLDARMQVSLMHGIANGLAFMHEKNVLHCDLKSGNVVLKANPIPGGIPIPLICDFGFSRIIDDPFHSLTKISGSPPNMPPEHLRKYVKRALPPHPHSEKTDVYSAIIMFMGIILGEEDAFPWFKDNMNITLPEEKLYIWNTKDLDLRVLVIWVCIKNMRAKFPPDTDENLKNLIEQGWSSIPEKRQTALELCAQLAAILLTLPPTNFPVALLSQKKYSNSSESSYDSSTISSSAFFDRVPRVKAFVGKKAIEEARADLVAGGSLTIFPKRGKISTKPDVIFRRKCKP